MKIIVPITLYYIPIDRKLNFADRMATYLIKISSKFSISENMMRIQSKVIYRVRHKFCNTLGFDHISLNIGRSDL
jgi:hypothetical protein